MALRSSRTLVVAAVLVGALAGAALAVTVVGPATPNAGPGADPGTASGPSDSDVSTVAQFENASAFQAYVARGQARGGAAGGVEFQGGARTGVDDGARPRPEPDDAAGGTARPAPTGTPELVEDTPVAAETEASGSDGGDRVGETNVQVGGLDEPDVVKTDGRHFYYAPEPRPRPVADRSRSATATPRPPRRTAETHVIDADDPADPRAVAEIDANGRMLQTGDRLLVLGDDHVTGYDVSDPAEPSEVWERPLADSLVTARERNGTVYLVTRSRVGGTGPCPLEPLGSDAAVPCGEIYRPDAQLDVDATYTAFAVDAADGDVRDSVSFVGTGRESAVYMSHESLYVTYTQRSRPSTYMAEFLTTEFDRTPDHVVERIDELRSYDISQSSRNREVDRAVQTWLDSLNESERRTVSESLSEGFQAYLADRQRDLQRTGVVRVGVDGTDLSVADTGAVPGRPLNQFSLSEREGTLRIATTVPGAGEAESQNDLYVLDAESLSTIGSVTGMGEGQEVYAVRYVDDTAYVVTFRQVDPLHVVDLSDPSDPVERGTLELPGFSSYLHPIDENHVLGIGEEDGTVKTVLFDVSDPTDPQIADDRIYDSRWSAVAESHHAFTIDRRHEVFFLPAGESAHVVDYANGTLSTEHTVETSVRSERARYVGDYLYVFAGTEVAVVDERTWERETTLDLATEA